jgi:hypothetical protein
MNSDKLTPYGIYYTLYNTAPSAIRGMGKSCAIVPCSSVDGMKKLPAKGIF